jgi:hypothetical protein
MELTQPDPAAAPVRWPKLTDPDPAQAPVQPPNLKGHRGFVADMIKKGRPDLDITDEMIDKQIEHINGQLKNQKGSLKIEDIYQGFRQ